MFEMGMVMMGFGIGIGVECVREVVEVVILSFFLEDINIMGVCGILVNIMVGFNIGMNEIVEVGFYIEVLVFDDVIVVVGIVIDELMEERLCVMLVVIGFGV